MAQKNVPFTTIEFTGPDAVADAGGLRAELGALTGRTSVPSIWIGGTCIGGCNDGPAPYNGLLTLQKQGKLDDVLLDAGVAL